jgi:hypothetical protein
MVFVTSTPPADHARRPRCIPSFAVTAVALAVAGGLLLRSWPWALTSLIWAAVTRMGVRRFRPQLATWWPIITGTVWRAVAGIWKLTS